MNSFINLCMKHTLFPIHFQILQALFEHFRSTKAECWLGAVTCCDVLVLSEAETHSQCLRLNVAENCILCGRWPVARSRTCTLRANIWRKPQLCGSLALRARYLHHLKVKFAKRSLHGGKASKGADKLESFSDKCNSVQSHCCNLWLHRRLFHVDQDKAKVFGRRSGSFADSKTAR